MLKYLIQDDNGLFLKALNPEIWTPDRLVAWEMTPDELISAIFQFENEPGLLNKIEIIEAPTFEETNRRLDLIDMDLADVEQGYMEQSHQLRDFNSDMSELI